MEEKFYPLTIEDCRKICTLYDVYKYDIQAKMNEEDFKIFSDVINKLCAELDYIS